MTDHFGSFTQWPSRSQMGQWINENVGLATEREAFARPGAPTLRAVHTERPRRVDLWDWREATERAEAWADLATRSLEQNVFLDPGFALTAAQHLPPARKPLFLAVSDATRVGDPERLIGVCAFDASGEFRAFARGWLPKQAALGTPLLDRARGGEAVDLMLDWFERERPKTAGLLLPSLAGNGPTAELLRSRAAALGLASHDIDKGARAILNAGEDDDALLRRTMSSRHLKELRRQYRRLADKGAVTYATAREPSEIRIAVESFLTLEARGWKGGRGTALLSDPAIAAFVRTMTRRLSREGKCRVEALELNGTPIAMGVVLTSGPRSFLWKIAYDESYASYSPGVQFTLEFTRRQLGRVETEATDSCAIPDHPMIDRLWADRMPIADVAFAVSRARGRSFEAAMRGEIRRRRMHDYAKSLYYRLTGRRRS